MSRLTDECGDYVYIGSNRNLMYFGVLQYADSLDNEALLTDILTNGEVPTDCTNYECYQAIIARYNLKTSEIEKYFDSADYGLDSPFGLIWGFRAAVTFKGALYMNANSVLRGSCLVRISGNDQKEPEILTGVGDVGSSGVSSCTMRAMCVSEDGSTMYVGGMESSNGRDCYTIYKTTDGETYEQIVGPKTDVTVFDRYEGAEYRTDGGDLWEITEYGGKLFVTLMTRKGTMVFTGQYDSTAGSGPGKNLPANKIPTMTPALAMWTTTHYLPSGLTTTSISSVFPT